MKILLATDGSESARDAVDFLTAFPFPAGSEVAVVTVIKQVVPEEEVAGLSDEQRRTLEEASGASQKEAGELVAADAERLRDAGFIASTALHTGHPAEEIIRAAAEMGADLIAVGSHGMSGVKRFLLGSVSDHVFRYAPCSVLIVKQPTALAEEGGPGPAFPAGERWRMLLAYDDSVPARKAVEFVTSLPLGDQMEVKVLSVLALIKMYRQDIRQQLNWVWVEKKQKAKRLLETVSDQLRGATPNVTSELVESADVSQAILDAGSAMPSDLIVLGHKGKGAIEKFLLGSVTARVAHHACCSVLAVRK